VAQGCACLADLRYEPAIEEEIVHAPGDTMSDESKDLAAGDLASGDVTDLILHDIQAGVLAPGSWLKQIDLERRYKRGRPDIRRALDRLSQKRLVEHVPHRGYHVYEPDGQQAAEVAEIRVVLETAWVDRIIANATENDIEALRALAERFQALILGGTVIDLYETNLAFHNKLISIAGNRELAALVLDIRQRTSSAPVSQWKTLGRVERSAAEHHAMVDALAARDEEALQHLVTEHIRQP